MNGRQSDCAKYDIVLVSLSDCDWWTYIAERIQWRKGDYKVIIGGAGLLHITPFLPFADYFVFGRGENTVPNLIKAIEGNGEYQTNSIVSAEDFSEDGEYYIEQVDRPYPHTLKLTEKRNYCEGAMGCNHKCLFCGYTWHRKFLSEKDYYQLVIGGIEDKELALLDYIDNKVCKLL